MYPGIIISAWRLKDDKETLLRISGGKVFQLEIVYMWKERVLVGIGVNNRSLKLYCV